MKLYIRIILLTITLDSFKVVRPSLLMLPIKNEIKIDVNISGEFSQ